MGDIIKVVRVGEQFDVILPCNPTTGYQWLEARDETKVALVEISFRPVSHNVGAGGEQIFIFQAMASGETSIALQYKRPWQPAPIDEKIVTVKIMRGVENSST